jgi:acetyl esterase/lipase
VTDPEPIEPFPGQALTDRARAAVEIGTRFVPGTAGAPDVRLLEYRPRDAEGTLPLIVSMHGGGFALRADHFPLVDANLAMLGAHVVSVDYRTVPDDIFPAAPEDCYAALCWAVDTLDIDAERVVVTGASAGGALAAAVTLMARDRGGPAIAFQSLVVPVLDDRCETPSMGQYEEAPLFGAALARSMWDTYLGPDVDRTDTPPYAAPNRARDLSGLPPAFIEVGGLDPLRDEGIEYAMRLMASGVPVELYCAPHLHHGVPEDARTMEQMARLHRDAIAAAIA